MLCGAALSPCKKTRNRPARSTTATETLLPLFSHSAIAVSAIVSAMRSDTSRCINTWASLAEDDVAAAKTTARLKVLYEPFICLPPPIGRPRLPGATPCFASHVGVFCNKEQPRRVGKGTLRGVSAWAKSYVRRAHASAIRQTILPSLRFVEHA